MLDRRIIGRVVDSVLPTRLSNGKSDDLIVNFSLHFLQVDKLDLWLGFLNFLDLQFVERVSFLLLKSSLLSAFLDVGVLVVDHADHVLLCLLQANVLGT